MNEPRGSAEWRYLRVAFVVVLAFVVAQLVGWLVYRSVHHGPTALSLTDRCLRREKLLSVGPVLDDPVARSARGGALATRVEGNGVHVAIATSDAEAAALVATYLEKTGRNVETRLERRGRVVYLWEQALAPTPTQRQTMYDCWYE
jgi:hypothetical protein